MEPQNPLKVSGGLASCYLSSKQMRALLEMVAERKLVRGQLVKAAVVRMLVAEGKLPESELKQIELKQEVLMSKPAPNATFRYTYSAEYDVPLTPEQKDLADKLARTNASDRQMRDTRKDKDERAKRIQRRREARATRERSRAKPE